MTGLIKQLEEVRALIDQGNLGEAEIRVNQILKGYQLKKLSDEVVIKWATIESYMNDHNGLPVALAAKDAKRSLACVNGAITAAAKLKGTLNNLNKEI